MAYVQHTPRFDDVQALVNLATGMGAAGRDPLLSLQIGEGSQLTEQAQDALVRGHKILRKVVELIPNQMTFRWGRLTLGGDDGDVDVQADVMRWMDEVTTRTAFNRYRGVDSAFNQAQKLANKTGNAALVLLVDDSNPLDAPLDLGRAKTFKGFFLVDRWTIKPDLAGLSVGELGDGITHYRLNGNSSSRSLKLVAANGKQIDMQQRIHRSRVLWFRGEELSDGMLRNSEGCDDSVLEGVHRAYMEYNAALRGAGRMLVDFDVFVHKVTGYFDKMMGDGSKEYRAKMEARLQANALMRSAYRGMVIDKELEELEDVTRSVAGYSDLMEQVLSNFLSNTDLQPSELLQRYPSGLANTGKTEQQNCNDRTRLYQGAKFDSNLRDFLRVCFALKDGPTKGKEPKIWDWDWVDLYPTTPLEQSELELNWAQIDANRIQSGVYSPDDAAKSHYSGPEFNPNITIDFKERERLKKEQEQQALAAAQQQDPNADPLAGLTFDAADSLTVPQQVKDAAKKGLQIRAQLDSGAIPARVALLGRKLSTGEALSKADAQTVQMYHQRNRKPPSTVGANLDTALYLLHGGPVGKVWADRALTPERMDAGKPCGAGFIEENLECHSEKSGAQSSAKQDFSKAAIGIAAIAGTAAFIAAPGIISALSPKRDKPKESAGEPVKYNFVDGIKFNDYGQPIIPDTEDSNSSQWKPSMTDAEAAKWASGSLYDKTFYHGTPDTKARNSIAKGGFRTDIVNNFRLYGDGVYTAEDYKEALRYAKNNANNVLGLKIRVTNPLVLSSGGIEGEPGVGALYSKFVEAHEKAKASEPEKYKDLQPYSQAITDVARALGHDAIVISNVKYFIPLSPKQVVVVQKKAKKPKSDAFRLDDDTPIKRTLDWKGFKIGLQYQPFDLRHEKLLPCGYGEIMGTTAADGMPLDCYVGTELDGDRVFVVSQLKADTGEFDEYKLFIGFDDDAPVIKDLFVSLMGQERFGGIKEIQPQQVFHFTEDEEREDAVRMDKPCGAGFISKEKQCRISGQKFSNYRKRMVDGLTEIRNGHDLIYIDRALEISGSYGRAGIQYRLSDLPEFNIPKGGNAKVLRSAAQRSGKVTEISFFPYLVSPSAFMGKEKSVKAGMGAVNQVLSKEEKRTLAFAAKNLGGRVLAQQQPGALLVNKPVGGANGARARIYEKMGFSSLEGKQVYQFAIVGSDKKLYPLQVYGAKKPPMMDAEDDDLALWYEAVFGEGLASGDHEDASEDPVTLAQTYIDAEERALAADGDVLDADEFDPEVDELDASEAVDDWQKDGGQFKLVLEANTSLGESRTDKACGESFISVNEECHVGQIKAPSIDLDKKEGFVGEGQFGACWLHKDPPAVVKHGRITPNETEALKALADSGFTPKLLKEEWGDTVKIAMSVVPGTPLGRLSDEDLAIASDGLIQTMKKLHERGYSHNDLHAGNVFYDTKTGKTYFVDFGMARHDEFSTLQEAVRQAKYFTFPEGTPTEQRFHGNYARLQKALVEDGFTKDQIRNIETDPFNEEHLNADQIKKYRGIMYDGI